MCSLVLDTPVVFPTVLVANTLNKSNSWTLTLHDLLKLLAFPTEWDFGRKARVTFLYILVGYYRHY